MSRPVVITGLGAVSGYGVGAAALWEGLLTGEPCLRPIQAFDASGFPCRLASEVPDFRGKDHVPKSYRKAVKVMARDIELAVAAAKAAVEDAGLITKGVAPDESDDPTYAPRRVGCHIGAGLIAAQIDELAPALATATDEQGAFSLRKWGDGSEGEGAMGNLQPLWLLKYLPNMLACHVTIIHDAQGPSNTITCAEASGLLSVGESMRVIQRGDADLCFSGGAESKVNPMGLLRMDLAKRLAHTGDAEQGADFVRPYDDDAPGGLLGEGAGILMVESEETAAARGTRPYARLSGFGAGHSPRTGDADRRGRGLRFAVERALEDAALRPEDVDAIVPHASGIREMDAHEAAALRQVFGGRLGEIPLITFTPMLGDAMAGHAGLAICIAALCLRHQTLPPRRHAGACPPDLCAGPAEQRDARLRHVVVCTNALGGPNAAVVLSSTRD